jgi:hypothetical protein
LKDPFDLNPETKAAIVIFCSVFVTVVIFLCIISLQISHIRSGEKRLLLAVAISSPFLSIRLVYSLLCDFSRNNNFNPYFGNTTIYLCMAVLEELAVATTCTCIVTGLTLQVIPKGAETEVEEVVPFTELANRDTRSNYSNIEAGAMHAEQRQYKQPDIRSNQAKCRSSAPVPKIRGGPVVMLYGYGKRYFQSGKGRAT